MSEPIEQLQDEEVPSAPPQEEDRRYRCMVLLNRADRPGVYTFHCPRCTMPVAELVNTEAVALTDTMEIDNGNLTGVGVRCDGRFQGKRCSIWYYYSLNGDDSASASVEHNDVRS